MDCPALLRLAEAVDRGLIHSVEVSSTSHLSPLNIQPFRVRALFAHNHRETDGLGKTVAEAAEVCVAAVTARVAARSADLADEVARADATRKLLA